MTAAGHKLRPRLGLTILVMLLLALLAPTGVVAQARPESRVPVPTAVDSFGACLAGKRSADVLLLIDQSETLKDTDPGNDRVTAARYLVRQWAGLSSSGIALNVAVSGFDSTYHQVQAWTPLKGAGLSQIDRTLLGFRDRNKGAQTDYWMALDGARRALSSKPRGQKSPCQAIVWFSDGKLDASATYVTGNQTVVKPYLRGRGGASNSQATKAARFDICRVGGVADQLRTSGVALFGIGLHAPGGKASDFQLMQSVATGRAAGTTCGKFIDPAPGDFRVVSDIDGLLFAFDRLRRPGRSVTEQRRGVCQGLPINATCVHRFVLDGSIRSVHVFASSGVDSGDVYLTPPGRSPMLLPRKGQRPSPQTAAGGVSYAWSWLTKRTLSVDLVAGKSATPWTGVWSLAFVDRLSNSKNAKSRTAVQISADILPTWQDSRVSLRRGGKPAPIRLGLVDGGGKAIDPTSLLGTMSVDAQVVDASGAVVPLATGLTKTNLATTSLVLDPGKVQEGAAKLRLVLKLTTKGVKTATGQVKGTVLEPQQVDFPIQVLPPLRYPIPANRVDFGGAQGAVELHRPLTFTGGGCVWLERGGVRIDAAPADAKPIVSAEKGTSAKDCLEVGGGGSSALPLLLTTEEPASGTVNGELTIHLAPKGAIDQARTMNVPFTADLQQAVDPVRRAWVFVLMLFLGVGIPVGLLYVAKWRSSRIPARALLAQSIPITVEDDRVRRDGGAFALRADDLRELVPVPAGGARVLTIAGAECAVTTGRSPFGSGTVTVTVAGQVALSSEDGTTASKTGSASLPLAVHNHWVLSHDPTGPATAGMVLLLIGGDADDRTRRKIVDDVNDRAPELFRRIRASLSGQSPTPQTSPLDDGGAGPSTGWSLRDPDAP